MGPVHATLTSVFTTATVTLTYAFVVSTMFSIGLAAGVQEFLAALLDYRLMGRVLLANIILVPILGMVLVKTFPLSTDTQTAILLLAFTPGGIQAIQFTSKVRSSIALAASVIFILSIIGIIVSPFLAELILPIETRVTIPFLHAMEFLLLFLLLPLLAGLALEYKAARIASPLYKPMLLISNVSFVATVVLSMAAIVVHEG